MNSGYVLTRQNCDPDTRRRGDPLPGSQRHLLKPDVLWRFPRPARGHSICTRGVRVAAALAADTAASHVLGEGIAAGPGGRGVITASRHVLIRREHRSASTMVVAEDLASDQFGAGGDAEFAEDLAQVVVDRAGAEIQPRGDVAVGQTLCYEPGDVELLRCELVETGDFALAGGLSGGAQFGLGPLHPWDGAEHAEKAGGGAQVGACLGALPLAAQPLPVEQFGPGAFERSEE